MQKEKDASTFFKVELCSAAGGGRPLADRVYLTLLGDGNTLLPEFLLGAPVVPQEPLFEAGATMTFVHRLPLVHAAVTAAKLRYRVAGAGLCEPALALVGVRLPWRWP